MIRHLTPLVPIALLMFPNLNAYSLGTADKLIRSESKYISNSVVASAKGKLLDCTNAIPPITKGYGANGSFSTIRETIPHPLWPRQTVYIFRPTGNSSPAPVIFFSHAFGATSPTSYSELIDHIVSRGYILVYSPYKAVRSTNSERYNALWAGFEAAVTEYGRFMDLTKVGFVGHSFGGGATPAMAYKGLVEKRWGSRGSFIYIMAPWYSFEITPAQSKNFPKNTKLLVQVYQDDRINDHRMAISIFNSIDVYDKDYVILQSDTNQNCQLTADHYVPLNAGRNGTLNGLDYWGVYRPFDALADFAFNRNSRGKNVALGRGSEEQKFMGTWPDGRKVKNLISSGNPQPTKSESYYRFPQSAKSRYNVGSQLDSALVESEPGFPDNTETDNYPSRVPRRRLCRVTGRC